MPGWNDLGNVFSTLRQLDVNAIREESERPLSLACVGPEAAFTTLADLLRSNGSRRYGPAGEDPLEHYPLNQVASAEESLRRSDMLIIALDGRTPLDPAGRAALERLARLALPTVIVLWHVAIAPGASSDLRPSFAHAHTVGIVDPQAPAAANALAMAIIERLPGELQLSAARRLPGLRPAVARQLVGGTSFTNASYALASALPEQLPIFNIPFAAADILVLTKNQALLVYKLALAHGAPPDFQARIREVLPVVGGAYLWRQAARTLIGLVPIWGVIPKVAVSYAGTYATGIAAWRWFADGEVVSGARLKQLSEEAMSLGRERAAAIVASARPNGQQRDGILRRFGSRLRGFLPGRRKPAGPENGSAGEGI